MLTHRSTSSDVNHTRALDDLRFDLIGRAETMRLLLAVAQEHHTHSPMFNEHDYDKWAAHGDQTHALLEGMAAVLRELHRAMEREVENLTVERPGRQGGTRAHPTA